MDIIEQLAAHSTLGLDTSVFIYHLEVHPRYLPLTQVLLAGVQAGQWTASTLAVTLVKLTARPWQLHRSAVAREYEVLLANPPHLSLLDVTRDVARRAAQLHAEYRLRPADALQVSTTLVHGATAFVSNDGGLLRLVPMLDTVLLDDLIAAGEAG